MVQKGVLRHNGQAIGLPNALCRWPLSLVWLWGDAPFMLMGWWAFGLLGVVRAVFLQANSVTVTRWKVLVM